MGEQRAIQYEILVTKCQIICTEIEGMKWENEILKQKDLPIFNTYGAFMDKAQDLKDLVAQFEKL